MAFNPDANNIGFEGAQQSVALLASPSGRFLGNCSFHNNLLSGAYDLGISATYPAGITMLSKNCALRD